MATTFKFDIPIRKADPLRAVTAAELDVHVKNLLALRKMDYADIMKLFREVGTMRSGLQDVMLIFEPILVEHQRTHHSPLLGDLVKASQASVSMATVRSGLFTPRSQWHGR